MGSIYRHNEGGAPLAVAECAHKLPLGFKETVTEVTLFRDWPEGRFWFLALFGMLAFGLVLPVTVERFAAAFGLPGVWPDWLGVYL